MGDQYRWMFPFNVLFMALVLLVMLPIRRAKRVASLAA